MPRKKIRKRRRILEAIKNDIGHKNGDVDLNYELSF
jgi:hypothetical protein